jgi:hypothetical protein
MMVGTPARHHLPRLMPRAIATGDAPSGPLGTDRGAVEHRSL